ncbi:MAG TPA: twin-arginine translocase subunit TatC [Thermoguttaceae bacterium]|nr:twin-arginine translocase subunit TatC [Thermoguttaceae bacterium]
MPLRKPDKDLFANSTMTFGEHLEELRKCLWKSVVALVVCTCIGLIPMVSGAVVAMVQTPLEHALATYYESDTTERAQEIAAAQRPDGELPPDEADRIARFIDENHLLMEEVLVNPDWILHELRRHDPARFGGDPAAADAAPMPTSREDLVPMLLFHPTGDDPRVRTKSLAVQEPFMIYVKASLLVGVLLASPYVFYQIWSFVAAGLYPREKHYVHVFLPFSLGLFLAGAALAFFFVFEPLLLFLFSFNRSLGIETEPRITEWMHFMLLMPLGFGVSFQLPLVMLFMERIGVVTISSYLKQWRIAVLVIFIAAMILTPSSDPYSMLLMAFPLTALYFGGVLLCKHMPRRRSPFDEA